jgi:hypothetical protein
MTELLIKHLKNVVPSTGNHQIDTIKKILKLKPTVDIKEEFHLLSDRVTGRIILFSNEANIIRSLSNIPNTHPSYNITINNSLGARNWKIPEDLDYICPWNYEDMTQKVYSNSCIKTTEPLTHEKIYQFYLINQKYHLLQLMYSIMKTLYLEIGFNVDPFQMTIYQEKYRQAVSFLNNVPDDINYIESWASINDWDLETASKDIKLNYTLFHSKLCKLEHVRLKYTKQVLDEFDVTKLQDILEDFKKYNFGYMKL